MLDEEFEQQAGGTDRGLVVVIGVEAADAGDAGHHHIIAVAVHLVQGHGGADGALEAASAPAGPLVDPVRHVLLLHARNHLLILVHRFGGILHPVRGQADGLEELELMGNPAVRRVVEVGVRVGIDVLGHVVDVFQGALQELSRPVEVAQERDRELGLEGLAVIAVLAALLRDGSARGDEFDGRVLLQHLLAEVIVLQHIVRRGHMAELPLAVAFVAHAPVDHAIGSGVSVLRAQGPHRGALGAVHVFHPLPGGVGVAESGVYDEVGLAAQQPAPGQVFVGAHVVGLHRVPGIVVAGRTLVRIADAVAPLITGQEVAARPAVDGGADFLQDSDQVGPEAFQVVCRHQRDGSDPEAAAAFSHDLQGGVLHVRTGRKVKIVLFVILCQSVEDDGLAVGGAGTPDQADGDLRGTVGPENDAAFIRPSLFQPQAGLPDTVPAGAQADDG